MKPSEGNPGGGDPVLHDQGDDDSYTHHFPTDGTYSDTRGQGWTEPPSYDQWNRALDALKVITSRKFPCRICGRPHERRVWNDNGTLRSTWADPDDDHDYAMINYSEFARQVLKELEA